MTFVIATRTQVPQDSLCRIAESLRAAAGVVERIRDAEGFDARYRLWGDFGLLLDQVDRLLPDDPSEV